jgi:hypothetical protein
MRGSNCMNKRNRRHDSTRYNSRRLRRSYITVIRLLLAVSIVGLNGGQGCSPAPPTPSPTIDDNQEGPGSNTFGRIPGGYYAGEGLLRSEIVSPTTGFVPETSESAGTIQAEFNESGQLLDEDGKPYEVGNEYVLGEDPAVRVETVSDVIYIGASGVVAPSVTVFLDVEQVTGDLTLTGYKRITCTLEPNGMVLYDSEEQITGSAVLLSSWMVGELALLFSP